MVRSTAFQIPILHPPCPSRLVLLSAGRRLGLIWVPISRFRVLNRYPLPGMLVFSRACACRVAAKAVRGPGPFSSPAFPETLFRFIPELVFPAPPRPLPSPHPLLNRGHAWRFGSGSLCRASQDPAPGLAKPPWPIPRSIPPGTSFLRSRTQPWGFLPG